MVETYRQEGIFRLVSFVLPLTLLLLLTLRSSFFPYPEILTEIYFLKQGMLPYVQINDQHFPGVMLTPLNLSTFGISTVAGLRVAHLLLISFNFILLAKLLKQSRPVIKLLSLLLYSLFLFSWEGNTLWIDSFVTSISLLGFYLLESGWIFKNYLTYFFGGLAFGALLTFKQHGIFLCLASGIWIITHKPTLKHLFVFILGGILPMGFAMIYLHQVGVFKEFWYWTISHNLGVYRSLEGKAPTLGELLRFSSLALPAAASMIFVKTKKFLPCFYLVLSLIYIFPRFGLIHAQVALPILIYIISRKVKLIQLAFLLSLGAFFTIRVLVKDTPGKIYYYDQNSQETVNYVKSHAQLGRPIYLYGVNDNTYHLTQTLPPSKTWIELLKGNIIPGVENTIISTLITDPPQFILVDPQASIDNQKVSEFTPHINTYIKDNFNKNLSLANGTEVWYAK